MVGIGTFLSINIAKIYKLLTSAIRQCESFFTYKGNVSITMPKNLLLSVQAKRIEVDGSNQVSSYFDDVTLIMSTGIFVFPR
ncbi:hypothetical protein CXF95_21830 [Paraglaciecola sp. MB-3u-78]|nr:hypothetical protein CXF95_21830 [Paraglaciecola sp. MB-3u-78]